MKTVTHQVIKIDVVEEQEKLEEPNDNVDENGVSKEPFKNLKVIVVTSGKGGVGKTTSSAAIATGIAQKGYKTAVIDFDVGLRNLDLIMGCERRVVYDFINVIQGGDRQGCGEKVTVGNAHSS